MTIFSVHLARLPVLTSVGLLVRPPTARTVAGLTYAECMTRMTLGAPILSPARLQLGHALLFAAWENETALDAFLTGSALGERFARGWHVRLQFVRRWGSVRALDAFAPQAEELAPSAPVVALTLARMRLPQVPRFIRWGRPVEELVRDHPGATLAMAAIRFPRTVSTFTIWRSQREMLDMVRGHGEMPRPERHATAMVERSRKDFHFEFTTLRFRPLSEHGAWEGRRDLVPR